MTATETVIFVMTSLEIVGTKEVRDMITKDLIHVAS